MSKAAITSIIIGIVVVAAGVFIVLQDNNGDVAEENGIEEETTTVPSTTSTDDMADTEESETTTEEEGDTQTNGGTGDTTDGTTGGGTDDTDETQDEGDTQDGDTQDGDTEDDTTQASVSYTITADDDSCTVNGQDCTGAGSTSPLVAEVGAEVTLTFDVRPQPDTYFAGLQFSSSKFDTTVEPGGEATVSFVLDNNLSFDATWPSNGRFKWDSTIVAQ